MSCAQFKCHAINLNDIHLIQMSCAQFKCHALNSNAMRSIQMSCAQFINHAHLKEKKSLRLTCQVSALWRPVHLSYGLALVRDLEKMVDRVTDTRTTTLSPLLEKLVWPVPNQHATKSIILVSKDLGGPSACVSSQHTTKCSHVYPPWYSKHMLHQCFSQNRKLGTNGY